MCSFIHTSVRPSPPALAFPLLFSDGRCELQFFALSPSPIPPKHFSPNEAQAAIVWALPV